MREWEIEVTVTMRRYFKIPAEESETAEDVAYDLVDQMTQFDSPDWEIDDIVTLPMADVDD